VRVLSRGLSHISATDALGYSLSVSMETSVSSCAGTVAYVRDFGWAGMVSAPNRWRMSASMAFTSKSPTAMTVMRSGRYQSR
jgi:hypothetical protein